MAEGTTIQVTIDPEVDELEVVFCPVCKSMDPFDTGDYEYQCQSCGAEFVVLSGRKDLDE